MVPDSFDGLPVTEQANDFQVFDSSIQRVVLPETLVSIGSNAFYFNDALTEINLPDSLETIGSGAFQFCYALREITIPPKVTELPSKLFYFCRNLKVIIPASVVTIADDAFSYASVTLVANRFTYADTFARANGIPIEYPERIATLPADLEVLDAQALADTAVEGVVLQSHTRAIGAGAFSGCDRLVWVEVPASVTEIDDTAFCDNPDVIIAAPAGSAAAAYAERKGMTLHTLD